MSGLRRFTMHPDRLRAEHEHARTLAATSLVEALSPADSAVLASHLDTCRVCRQAALDYALQGERIHNLAEIGLPRDAWPAFAARLDIEEARVAEQRARRAGNRRVASQAHPLGGRPSRAPGAFIPTAAGAGAGLRGSPVVASVGVGSLLALVATIALVASGLPQMIVGPSATPFAVDPSSVAWVTRQADGRFLLQTAALDSACPSGGAACTDFGQTPNTIVALDMEPASVFLARDGRDAIVVDAGAAGAGTSGGSVYAIQLPTPNPGSGGSGASGAAGTSGAAGVAGATGGSRGWRSPDTTDVPGGIAAGAAVATAIATAAAVSPAPTSSPRAALVPPATPPYPTTKPAAAGATTGPVASFVTAGGPGASLPAAVPLPTAAATRAIAEGVVLVGGRAGYSPDGRWFAFSARPADASAGPDVYLWRVGDERSRAVTTDHAAVFAGWAGSRLLVSSPDGGVAKVADATPDPAADNVAKGDAQAAATTAPKGVSGTAAATGATPVATPKPKKGATPSPDADGSAGGAPATEGETPEKASPPGASGEASPAEAPAGLVTTPASYLLDPTSGTITPIELPGLWLPSVDPTGSRVVAWLGTVRADAPTRAWRPAEGSLVVGSWPSVLAGVAASPAPAGGTPGATTKAAPNATAEPEATDTPTGGAGPADDPTPSADTDATPAAAADADAATPTPADGATAAPKADPTASPDATSADDATDGAPGAAPPATGAATTAAGAPTALVIAGLTGPPPSSWLVRWDPTGTHLAVWIADAETPEVGKLSLLAVEPSGAKAPALLLSSAPAMPGFAMGKSRIAWATPADGTPAGGRVRVLVWSGRGVGEAGTAPIRGLETLVDAD
jgi:hypothetical protein